MLKIKNPDRRSGKSRFLIPTVFLALLVGIAGLGISLSRSIDERHIAGGPISPPVPVIVDQVRSADVPIYVEGIGVVRPFSAVTVRARVEGEINRIDFREGQDVNAGDALAQIDPRPYQAQLDQAKAKKASDEARLENTKADLQRDLKLADRGTVPRQVADTQKALVAQMIADVQGDQAAIDGATVQLGYTNISAPISGRVGMRLVDQGNVVRTSDATGIVTINKIRPITVDVALPAETLPRIRVGMKAGDILVLAQDRDGIDLGQGKLAVIDNQVDPATATIHCKATFENTDEMLWPGQFVNVRLKLDVRRGAITVPRSAIVNGPDGTYAFIIDANHVAQKQAVKVSFFDKMVAVIDEGLRPGEQVVVDGQHRVQAGGAVEILPAGAAGKT